MAKTKTNYCEEIKAMRQELGLTQKQFGELIGCPTPNISRWEQGIVSPPDYVFGLIQKVLEQNKQLEQGNLPEKTADMVTQFYIDCGKELPEHRQLQPQELPDKITPASACCSKIARIFNFLPFYWQELQIWNENPIYRGVPLDLYLYANRWKYIQKRPEQLSDAEILRGLRIAGVVRGYTVFDNSLMKQFLDKYGDEVTGIYDPCHGWGERLLTSCLYDIPYHGVDINENVVWGLESMIKYFEWEDKAFVFNDDSSVIWPSNSPFLDKLNTFFTCPPYFATEWYSEFGAENLDYDEFLHWWDMECSVANGLGLEFFCFQINSKYRDDMLKIVESWGYELIDEMYFTNKNNKSSHFTRKKDGINLKHEQETLLVLRKTSYPRLPKGEYLEPIGKVCHN